MKIVFAYITIPSIALAETLGRRVVEEKLAACVNIIPGMKSIYAWNDKIEQAEEVVLIAKTTQDRFAALSSFVRMHHPYDVSCIVALDVAAGDETFINWIADCVKD